LVEEELDSSSWTKVSQTACVALESILRCHWRQKGVDLAQSLLANFAPIIFDGFLAKSDGFSYLGR